MDARATPAMLGAQRWCNQIAGDTGANSCIVGGARHRRRFRSPARPASGSQREESGHAGGEPVKKPVGVVARGRRDGGHEPVVRLGRRAARHGPRGGDLARPPGRCCPAACRPASCSGRCVSSIGGIADRYDPRRVFAISALLAALVNIDAARRCRSAATSPFSPASSPGPRLQASTRSACASPWAGACATAACSSG